MSDVEERAKEVGEEKAGKDEQNIREKLLMEIQNLKREVGMKVDRINQLRKEIDWVIQDFAKSLQFHKGNTQEFQEGIIREQIKKHVGG